MIDIDHERMKALRSLGGQEGARERIALTTDAADRLVVVSSYGGAAIQAAVRDAIETFRTAVRRQGAGNLSDVEIDVVANAMAARMLTRATGVVGRKNEELRSEIIALGGVAEDAPAQTL